MQITLWTNRILIACCCDVEHVVTQHYSLWKWACSSGSAAVQQWCNISSLLAIWTGRRWRFGIKIDWTGLCACAAATLSHLTRYDVDSCCHTSTLCCVLSEQPAASCCYVICGEGADLVGIFTFYCHNRTIFTYKSWAPMWLPAPWQMATLPASWRPSSNTAGEEPVI